MALTNSQITAQNFQDYHNMILPYLGFKAHTGFTPIGTVIAVMGTTAPQNYLACDGTAYNIADYMELATYFTAQFGSANIFGGDGTTTFAVPDLRGEFLRGTGTNSHTNQGSGANVGVHQDGTLIPTAYGDSNKRVYGCQSTIGNEQYTSLAVNVDYQMDSSADTCTSDTTGQYNVRVMEGKGHYTSRPTNTSVLYCIASKNIFMDAGMNYSTDEQIVGTWLGGEPIYQKTIYASGITAGSYTTPHGVSDLKNVIHIDAVALGTNKSYPVPFTYGGNTVSTTWNAGVGISGNNILFEWGTSFVSEIATSAYVTIQYTKSV